MEQPSKQPFGDFPLLRASRTNMRNRFMNNQAVVSLGAAAYYILKQYVIHLWMEFGCRR
jgi:hypothetical protein